MKINRSMYPWLLWLSLIWIVSSLPSDNLPSYMNKIVGIDKLAHFTQYLILGLLVNRWLKRMNMSGKKSLYMYGFILALALIDELHQIFIPGRSFSVYDMIANGSGLVCGYLILRIQK